MRTPTTTIGIRQERLEGLLAGLGAGRLHVVMSDSVPIGAERLQPHPLGTSDIALFASPALAKQYRPGFPGSLRGAPLLLPSPESPLRRSLDRWFAERRIQVNVVAEVEDAGMLRALGAEGLGLFPVRVALSAQGAESSSMTPVGKLEALTEPYFALTLRRKVDNPAVVALIAGARRRLVATP